MDIRSLLLRPHFRIDEGPKKPRYQDQKRTHTKLSRGGEVIQRDKIRHVKGNNKRGNREGGGWVSRINKRLKIEKTEHVQDKIFISDRCVQLPPPQYSHEINITPPSQEDVE